MKISLIFFAASLLILSSCAKVPQSTRIDTPPAAVETEVSETTPELSSTAAPEASADQNACDLVELMLPTPWSIDKAEYSGAAIHADYLYLLPQYPRRLGRDAGGQLGRIALGGIKDSVSGSSAFKANVEPVILDDGGLAGKILGFEGFESISFNGSQVFMTIESRRATGMRGYLVQGSLDEAKAEINLDPETLIELPAQNNSSNASDEASFFYKGSLYTIYEQNGPGQNPNAFARQFQPPYLDAAEVEMTSVNFRITDAAADEPESKLYLLNYFFPGDTHMLPAQGLVPDIADPSDFDPQVSFARILEFNIQGDNLEYQPGQDRRIKEPIAGEAYNWEGLAYWPGEGFFLVTDSFPRTFLGFCRNK